MRSWVKRCAVGVSVGLASGAGCTILLERHCTNMEGDATCVGRGQGSYCSMCVAANDGCSDVMPSEDCYFAGWGGESSGEATDGGTTSSGVTVATETSSSSETLESSTTGPIPCMSSEECTEPGAPLCGIMGECGTCETTEDPDGACASVDETTPLCVNGACVACTPENPAVCDAMLMVCDGATSTCVPCTEHEQCASGACELAVGTCFSPDVVVHVDGDGGQDFTGVGAAVNSIGDGMRGVIVVHELDGGAAYQGSVLIDGDKIIALQATLGEQPIMRGTSSNPSVLVTGATTALYVDGLRLAAHTSGLGLSIDGALVWVDRSHIVQNAAGGILATNGAELTVRNSFVGDGTNGEHALTVDGSSATVLSTTLGVGVDNFADVFPVFCTGTTDVTIRNSLLVSFDGPSELSCAGAMVTHTASEALIPGPGNVALGNIAMDWFMGVNVGDFHLDNPPMALSTTASWVDGDPPTDIDGDPRPTVDGTPDSAGADIP